MSDRINRYEIIKLETKNTTYQIGIDQQGFLLHLYYGKKVACDMDYLLTFYDRGFSGNPYTAGDDRTFSLDSLPQEFPYQGIGDYRTVAFNMQDERGVYGCNLRYKSHKRVSGKYGIPNLPAVYAKEEQAETVEIILEDLDTGIEVALLYGVLFECDVITRSVTVKNIGKEAIKLDKIYSGVLDFVCGDYDILHFHGKHGMERIMERLPITYGVHSYGSKRGTSSHQENPFIILAEEATTDDYGDCYGMSLLYSGNFKCEVEKDQIGQIRVGIGLSDEMFSYTLNPDEVFYAPEVAYSYSDAGLNELSQKFHHLIRHHICRGKYKTVRRPVLINNWEATYFDFTGEKIVEIAKEAAGLGVEMLVLDDGWFGARNSDNAGLGDWFVNEEKMNGTLSSVVEKVNNLGMKFGLWIEPEMVNEDSELFRKHPDWAFTIPGRKPVRSRNQLVLDFSRKEVVDYIFEQLEVVLDAANIEYIKMDMNRSICDVYSAVLGQQNQGEILYKYVLGVYDFMERINTKYPDLFIEGCSGGGGRFDAGMLYYTPQIWCSDNTDAIERIKIQHGTSFGYPISSVGSHVSACPNHQTGRTVHMKTRGVVAMAGSFGYELDLCKITEEEKEIVKEQIKSYINYWDIIQNGTYYRCHLPEKDTEIAVWNFVSVDKSKALLNVVSLNTQCNGPVSYAKCKGLDPNKLYKKEGCETIYSGEALMKVGMPVPRMENEYEALQVLFVEA
ncbi:MAG: alpha-galactosidase [Lachnospiraceae bacterium]